MSVVYAVQRQMVLDQGTGVLTPKHDLSAAERFGRVVPLLGPTAGSFAAQETIAELRQKLEPFCEDDYLLPVGNPCLIGWAVALASQRCPRLKILQWSSRHRVYVPIECDLGVTEITRFE